MNIAKNKLDGFNRLIFPLFFLSICWLLYKDNFHFYPFFHHAWAQTDRYALALGFYENGMNLFLPTSYNLETTGGITAADLALSEYLAAIFMQISGWQTPQVLKISNLLFAFTAYCFLYKWVYNQTNSIIKSIFACIFFATLPIFVYYQSGFSPSLNAFFVWLISLCYYLNYLENNRVKNLYLSVFLACLAALIRKPFILFLAGMALYQFIANILAKRYFYKPFYLSFGLSFCLFIIFYLYNDYISQKYGTRFLNKFMPATNWLEFKELSAHIFYKWGFKYAEIFHYLSLFTLFILQFILFKWDNFSKKIILHLFIFLSVGIAYFVLMTKQFVHHEYYFVDSFMPFIALLFILFCYNLKYIHNSKFSQFINLILICFSALLVKKAVANQLENYKINPQDMYYQVYNNFEGADKFLDSLNIPKQATFLVIDAYSTNSPLIQLRRKGFCNLTTSEKEIKKDMERFKYDYIIVQNNLYKEGVLDNYPQFALLVDTVATNGKISILRGK